MSKDMKVYRGMDADHNIDTDVWVTTDKEYAKHFAEQEYNENGIVKEYIMSEDVLQDLCDEDEFVAVMNDYDAWQEIPDDSPVWDEGDEDVEYDLMHDLCFPSDEQKDILKKEGYAGLVFEYMTGVDSILLFNGNCLKEIKKPVR